MSVLIAQISYLPDTDVRDQRLVASRTQIDWLHKLLPGEKIVSLCQNYHDGEKPKNVDVWSVQHALGAGQARNVILEYFYPTDYDWLFLCDDDTTAYEMYYYEDFIRDIVYHPDKFKEIDAVSAVEPEYHPYKKLNFEDKGNLTHYKFEPRELNSGSATSIIRNVRKYHDKRLLYPDTDASKGEGREDIEFLLSWLLSGLNWYIMDTWIRKSLCFDKSSIFGTDTKARDALLMHDLDVVCDKFKQYGLQRNMNGKITWSAFNETYNNSKKLLYIERETPITFEENVIPKQKTDNSMKLF